MNKNECSSFLVDKDLSSSSSNGQHFRTSSPVSVLESSSSCSGDQKPEVNVGPGKCGRARSKRPRPATFTPRPPMQHLVISPTSSITETQTQTQTPHAARVGVDEEEPQQQQAVRKCMHCEVTKTPQWRAGPMGPKTLCNACGVRFKSGRLFPEYRPAASPTFVPTLHSNSHKKVVEMRTKVVGDEMFGNIDGCMIPDSPELLIPGNNLAMEEYM
ncbi:GATA transcription factor 8 [Linum grandiflorum]